MEVSPNILAISLPLEIESPEYKATLFK